LPHRPVTIVLSEIEKRRAGRHLLLLCDFDGTLVAFHPDPAAVVLDHDLRGVLSVLSRTPGTTVGIVSGRHLPDLHQRASLPGPIFLAGSHGLEIDGPGESFRHPQAGDATRTLRGIAENVRPRLAGLPGVFIEDKEISIALHYREAAAGAVAAARLLFMAAAQAHLDAGHLRLLPGADVLELLPAIAWDKGDAVNWIRDRAEGAHGAALTVYIGDDVTDQHAFRAVGPAGVTIAASERPSGAEFTLDGPANVRRLLRMLMVRTRR
jgi:alpha,alpha-trehalase